MFMGKWERASLSRMSRRVEVKKQKLKLPCAQPNFCMFAKSNAFEVKTTYTKSFLPESADREKPPHRPSDYFGLD